MDETRAASLARDALADYEHANPEPIAQALREVWLRAVPARPIALSPGQQAFVRDWGIADPEFAAAGTPVPILTAMGKEIGRLARKGVSEYLPLTRLLWEDYGREGRIVAVVALGPMELAEPEAVMPVLREMAHTCVFWEDCDQLAMKALEPVLRRDPGRWLDLLGAWVLDENKWVKRAGLTAIGRLPMKVAAYTERCVALVAPALGDADMDVKRALSFALRVCARGDPEPVRRFVLSNQEADDVHSLWVMSDLVRSMTRSLLPEFAELLPVYQAWLRRAVPQARRSVEAAVRVLEGVPR
ncbi:MAG TPA: DNA alkylation repair protein [Anaerolineae bacterium]|nr:DNA alkylation repair protein [Anaerolineae bacterium]